MNIFFLDHNPYEAARMLCDKHVPKMLLVSTQMLSTLAHSSGWGCEHLYKCTHVNHPCNKWLRETLYAEMWLQSHTISLCLEYSKRSKKAHKSAVVFRHYLHKWASPQLSPIWTPALLRHMNPPQVMPEMYRIQGDPVSAYRQYYIHEKSFAKWEKGTEKPYWMPNESISI